ncbi:metallophosphoesterase [Paenibacillus sp. GCM10027626]|uniref:metallophosphoesterase family protein n=1 Tax=Paenibacillus sp. GCM10027626 TaxID=3273411 RepID=UPI003631B8E8
MPRLHITQIDEEPVEQFSYRCASVGSKGIAERMLPIYKGCMAGLPPALHALIVASDLQGTIFRGPDEVLIGETLPEYLLLLLGMEYPGIDGRKVGVLLCGDLYADPEQRGSSGSPVRVWQAFRQYFGWVAGVAGNHDVLQPGELELLQSDSGIYFMDTPSIVEPDGLRIAGLGGVIGRPDKPNRTPEQQYLRTIQQLLARQPDSLLLHQSPDYPALQFEGSAQIRQTLEATPATVVFCGHSHWEAALVRLANGTQVLNVDAKVFIFTE